MTQLSNTQCYLYKTIPHIQQLGRSDKWSNILKRNKEGSTFTKHHCLTAYIFSIWNISQAASITKAARGCDSRLLMVNASSRLPHPWEYNVPGSTYTLTQARVKQWNEHKNAVFIYCPGDTVTLDNLYSAFAADEAATSHQRKIPQGLQESPRHSWAPTGRGERQHEACRLSTINTFLPVKASELPAGWSWRWKRIYAYMGHNKWKSD